ncbi:MAG: SBBP repeat-containing protein [Acidobacteria bacterium]|nr:SBBP repeat-containing protein [Acidobacteriota bacterium]
MKDLIRLLLLTIFLGLAVLPMCFSSQSISVSADSIAISLLVTPDASKYARLSESYGKLPLSFEENRGQVDAAVKFLSRGSSYGLSLMPAEAVLMLKGEGRARIDNGKNTQSFTSLRMRFTGADFNAQIEGLDPLPGRSNYLIGSDPKFWHTNIPNYARVRYRELYPGIDLIFYGNRQQLEYDFVIAPGADPGRIKVFFDGAKRARVDAVSALAIAPSNPSTLYTASSMHQIYKSVDGGNTWSEIDTGLPRQVVLTLAVDAINQNVVYAGTGSNLSPYKSTDGGVTWSPMNNGLSDSGVVSIVIDPRNPSTLYAASRQGVYKSADSGANWNAGIGLPEIVTPEITGFPLIIDPINTGTLYAAIPNSSGMNGIYKSTDSANTWGYSSSGITDSMVSALTIDPQEPAKLYAGTIRPDSDAFVAKLNSNGSAIDYIRYLGGSGVDSGVDIVVDALGRAYLTGFTFSDDFPTTPDAFQPIAGNALSKHSDAFVARLNPDGSIGYSTCLGGNIDDFGSAIALDSQGNVHLIGSTNAADFPTKNALQTTLAVPGKYDAFVARLNLSLPGKASLIYSTYLGGSDEDRGKDIAVDSAGNSYALLNTASNNLPVTRGALQTSGSGFLAKLNSDGTEFVYGTFLGSVTLMQVPPPLTGIPQQSATIIFNSLAVDSKSNVFLTGAAADKTHLPTTPGTFQTSHGNTICIGFSPQVVAICYDAFVMMVNDSGSFLLYGSYLGGSSFDSGQSIALDSPGNVYVTGESSSGNFPVTPNALSAPITRGFTSKIMIEPRSTDLANVSAASFIRGPLAPESIVAAFGVEMAHTADSSGTTNPFNTLGSVAIKVRDSDGKEREGQLYYVSPGQINYYLPAGTATGPAQISLTTSRARIAAEEINITTVAPGVFTANADGKGVAAAVMVRVKPDGSQLVEAVSRFDQAQNKFVAIPIDLGQETDRVFLSIFGTGWRFRSSESAVKVTIGGIDVPVTYAGIQPTFVGLDQINVQLSRSLAGKGEVDMVVTVDGKTANTAMVSVR